LSLGGEPSDAEISLLGSDVGDKGGRPAKGGRAQAAIQTDDDFRLTPLGDGEDDADSSSQVIALEEDMGEMGAGDAGILSADVFAEEVGGEAPLTADYEAGEEGFDVAAYGAAVAPRADAEYSVMNIVGLGSCFVLLLLGVTVSLDMVRNIWSWDQNLALNDSLLDSLLGLFGLS
jgi:hypothetical protein